MTLIDVDFQDGDWSRIRDLFRLLAQPPQSSYEDGTERQNGDRRVLDGVRHDRGRRRGVTPRVASFSHTRTNEQEQGENKKWSAHLE